MRLPQIFTYSGTEEAVDDGVGGRVEGRHTLHEGGELEHVGGVGYSPVHLTQVEHEVGAPAHDEHCNTADAEM